MESATASFRDGVLQIEMTAPQRHARARTLQISDSGSGPSRESSGESPQMGSGLQQQR